MLFVMLNGAQQNEESQSVYSLSRTMRIAILTNAYLSKDGGAGRMAALQVETLRALGYECHVWHLPLDWVSAGILIRMMHHMQDLFANASLAAEIARWKPDWLLTHNLTGCGFGTPSAVVRQCNARWVHTLHDGQLFEPSGQLMNETSFTWWQHAWVFLRKKAFGGPAHVISPTRWLLDAHFRRGLFSHAQTHVIPNPGPRIESISRALHTPIRLLFVGRVSEDKGTNLLAGIIQECRQPFVLDVVGDGPEKDDLCALGPSVRCHGHLDADAVRDCLREADILLVPSQMCENQPTVILEAASVGLPVIASDLGGMRETLQGKGMLCPANALEPWLQAIRHLSDPVVHEQAVADVYALAERYQPESYRAAMALLLRKP